MFKDELQKLEQHGLLRRLRSVGSAQGPRIILDGKEVINLCSNNYLGLASHPALKEAAIKATEKYGAGAGASRLISGTQDIHIELEERLARFKKTEAALVLNSGYTANLAVITTLAGRGDIIFSDKLNHASIVDGCLLSGAELLRYPHKDVSALEKMLHENSLSPRSGERVRVRGESKKLPPSSLSSPPFGGRRDNRRRLIITDTVFSMDGDIAPLVELVSLAEKYGCMLLVDEAHATGVFGENGAGIVEHFGIKQRFPKFYNSDNLIQMGTLSKAFGCFGGYIAGSKALIGYLVNKSRPFIYTTALPASVIASALAALDIIENQPDLRKQLWANVNFFKTGLRKKKGTVPAGDCPLFSQTQIIPLLIGDSRKAVEISDRLLEEAVFIQAIRPPSVPAGQARLRVTIMATHTRCDLHDALEKIEHVPWDVGGRKWEVGRKGNGHRVGVVCKCDYTYAV